MRHTLAAVAVLVGLASPAAAWSPTAEDEIGPVFGRGGAPVAFRTLESRGFYDIDVLRHRKGAYVVAATEPRGQRVIVTVSGASGRILDMKVTHWMPYYPRRDEMPIFHAAPAVTRMNGN